MNKIKDLVKKNYKVVIGIVIGITVCIGIGVSAVATKDVVYDNSKSGLTSTNLQGAIDELNTKAKTHCPDGYTCTKKPVSFASDSWTTIAKAVKSGTYPYSVGDTKTVDMGSLGTHTVRVANTSSCTNGETSKTACGFVVEFADIITNHRMNSSRTNVRGWPASEMRSYVNSTIYSALPSDLKNVIASTTVVSSHGPTSGEGNFTSTDKLYLLSSKEVWNGGTGYDTAEAETRQLDYYKNKGVTTSNKSGAIKKNNGSNAEWWLRSASSNDTSYFFDVYDGGGWGINFANYTNGVSPAFRIA